MSTMFLKKTTLKRYFIDLLKARLTFSNIPHFGICGSLFTNFCI